MFTKIVVLCFGVISATYISQIKCKELLRDPANGVTIQFKKRPFESPRIELRTLNGKLLEQEPLAKE